MPGISKTKKRCIFFQPEIVCQTLGLFSLKWLKNIRLAFLLSKNIFLIAHKNDHCTCAKPREIKLRQFQNNHFYFLISNFVMFAIWQYLK